MIVATTSAIILKSELNQWINICIVIDPYEDFLKAVEVAEQAFDSWFEEDTCDCIGDYIKLKLDEAELNYEMFFGNFDEDKEV